MLLLAAIFAGGTGWAAEAAREPSENDPAAGTTETSQPTGQTATGPTADVFIPTEDISEDFAVAFPVDI